MRKLLPWLLRVALVFGLFWGTLTPAEAVPQFSFGGYKRSVSNRGVKGQFPYLNVTVTTGQSLEWVMAGDGSGTKYIQFGWIKRTVDSGPRDFAEYACATVCQFIYSLIPSGTTRTYSVERSLPPDAPSDRWCARDGTNEVCIANGILGLSDAPHAYYTGETSDTSTHMGGTSASHYHMFDIQYKNTSGTWLQVDTANLIDITTAGTNYRASKGFTSPYSWVENWTVP